MENLSKTILNECREEVAKEIGFDSWHVFEHIPVHRLGEPRESEQKAAELALDRQAEFYEWVQSKSGRSFFNGFGYWGNNEEGYISTEKLYNIWREGK